MDNREIYVIHNLIVQTINSITEEDYTHAEEYIETVINTLDKVECDEVGECRRCSYLKRAVQISDDIKLLNKII